MNYNWRVPSQDPKALADRSHRSVICELQSCVFGACDTFKQQAFVVQLIIA